jgi:hypothetical protein
MSEAKILWDTYDFELQKIAELEDEYNFLLDEISKFFEKKKDDMFDKLQKDLGFPINTGNEEDNVSINRNILIEEFSRVTNNLLHFYTRQISTVEDIIIIYSNSNIKIPEGREVSIDYLNELLTVTSNLRNMVLNSKEEVKNLFDSD